MEETYQIRLIQIPIQKIAFFKKNWLSIYTPLVTSTTLQVRFNLKTSHIDLRSNINDNSLERCAHFITALLYGFTIEDSLKILRTSDTFTEVFKVTDVKKLKHGHVGRAVGRIVGRNGAVKGAIESSTNVKIVVRDETVYLLGSVDNMSVARHSVCRLIMGSEPGKVCNALRSVTGKIKERFGMLQSVVERIE